jgi:hypothetical protein
VRDKFSTKMLWQDAAGEQETGDEKDVILLNKNEGRYDTLADLIDDPDDPEGYNVTPIMNEDGSGGIDVAGSSTSSTAGIQTVDTPSQAKFQHVRSGKARSEVKKTVTKITRFKDNQVVNKKTLYSRILPEIAVAKYKGKDRCVHNRRWDSCPECSTGLKCYHGSRWRECPSCNHDCTVKCPHHRWKKKCMVCTPATFCSCGKVKRDCEKCNPCEHGKVVHKCYMCSPQHFCTEHTDSKNEPMHKYRCKQKHTPCEHDHVWYKCLHCGTSKGKGTK